MPNPCRWTVNGFSIYCRHKRLSMKFWNLKWATLGINITWVKNTVLLRKLGRPYHTWKKTNSPFWITLGNKFQIEKICKCNNQLEYIILDQIILFRTLVNVNREELVDSFPVAVREVCVRQSQLITSVAELLLPLTISKSCRVQYVQPDDPRFLVEPHGGDLVAGEDFCIPTDPPWMVKLTVDYICDKTRALLSPASHTIKVGFKSCSSGL